MAAESTADPKERIQAEWGWIREETTDSEGQTVPVC